MAVCILHFQSLAQKDIQLKQKSISFAGGQHTAFVVDIPEANFEKVNKNWTKHIRRKTKSKVEQVHDEVVIKGTLIKSINPQPISIYSIVLPLDSAVRIAAAFEIDSAFLVRMR